jgi:hypothetical protein
LYLLYYLRACDDWSTGPYLVNVTVSRKASSTSLGVTMYPYIEYYVDNLPVEGSEPSASDSCVVALPFRAVCRPTGSNGANRVCWDYFRLARDPPTIADRALPNHR